MSDATNVVLECVNLTKTFIDGKRELTVLREVNFKLLAGQQVAIIGRSGSGKSTLLQLLGGLDAPTGGAVFLAGRDLSYLLEQETEALRNKSLGFIYQMHHLLPEFTALENVAMPLLIAGVKRVDALRQARDLLVAVGLVDRAEHVPAKLSGGERQRVAIARALVMRPKCILADEPTGNLDVENAALVMQLLRDLNKEYATALVIVTHDLQIAKQLDATYTLDNLRLVKI